MRPTSLVHAERELSPVADREASEPARKAEDPAGRLRGLRPRWKLRAWGQHVLLFFLVAVFTAKGFIPAWRHLNSDFPNYYLVARLYRAGYPLERVYDWTWLQRQKDHQGIDQGLVSFIPSTLPSALLVVPWSKLSALEAKHRWLIVNLAFLLLTALLLVRITNLGWERVGLLIFLAFIPLRNNFVFGQMHVTVLLLVTLAAWLFFNDRHLLSGISLGAAAALKIFPALFLIYFAWKRRWRAAIGLVIGLGAAAGMAIRCFGTDACWLYLRQVLPAGLRGETLDPYNPAWNSWTALLRRLFIYEPELNPTPVVHLPWLYALLQPLIHILVFVVFMWAMGSEKSDARRTKLEWATFVFLLLFLSPQPASYHFVALILTALLVIDHLVADRRTLLMGGALAIYALVCGPIFRWPWASPTGWQNLLFFPRLAWMTAFAGVLLWILVARSPAAPFRAKNVALAATAVIALTTIGFVFTERHLRGQFEDYGARIGTTPGGLLASEPALSTAGAFVTTMTPAHYTVRRLQNGTATDLVESSSDFFHAAAADNTNSVWAEQATPDGSRVLRFTVNPSGQAHIEATEAADAQEPAVSRDGQLLAFLRPIKGRNSLWVRRIGATSLTGGAAQLFEVAGEEYDVHEAAFLSDHRLIFSSKVTGSFGLYIAAKPEEKRVIEKLDVPGCSARYPAVSPDGRWLALSCETGAAQIHVKELYGTRDLQVTFGDCNSISPAWTADSKSLVYASDCGRGLGLSALVQVTVFH